MSAPTVELDELSARQRQMLRWLADGLTVAEIAGRFRMRQAEVLREVAVLRGVFGARTDLQLVGIAYETGVFERVRAPWAAERDPRGCSVPEVPRLAGLTSKPRATADDARLLAARLECRPVEGGCRHCGGECVPGQSSCEWCRRVLGGES